MSDPRAIEAAARAMSGGDVAWSQLNDKAQAMFKESARDAVEGYLAAQPQETPEHKAGEWRWVPVEPTEEMKEAGRRTTVMHGWSKAGEHVSDPEEIYEVMLAAAPQKAIPDAEGLIADLRMMATFAKSPTAKELYTNVADALTAANARTQAIGLTHEMVCSSMQETIDKANERAEKAERERADHFAGWDGNVAHASLLNRAADEIQRLKNYDDMRSREAESFKTPADIALLIKARDREYDKRCALSAQVETIRAETVEACAKIADAATRDNTFGDFDKGYCLAGGDIAETIRALSKK